MRRISWVTAAAAAACLASAAPAAASGEIKDACGPGAIGGPPAYVIEPPAPWLDICDSDVGGVAGSGSLGAVRATLKLAGDVTARPGLAQYTFLFTTPHCGTSVALGDTVGGAGRVWVSGNCNPTSTPCPVIPGCFSSSGGETFTHDLPASAAQVAGNTVTLTLDPNVVRLPKALLADLGAGVLSSVEAISWVRADGKAADRQATAADPVDFAEGDKPVPLG